MTYEYAAYFRLLLLCGYSDELQQYVDTALNEQEPLSDVILDLSTAGSDNKKRLSALNAYLLQVNDTAVDYNNTVYSLVIEFLQRQYQNGSVTVKAVTELMYQLALHSQRHFEHPWNTLYLMDLFWDGVQAGYIDKKSFDQKWCAIMGED